MHDLAAGKARAAESNRLVLIDFYATWCEACRIMDRDVFGRQDVAEALSDWVAVKVDGDRHPELAVQYRVSGYPTFLALSPQGKVIAAAAGYFRPEQFIEWIQSTEKRWEGGGVSR